MSTQPPTRTFAVNPRPVFQVQPTKKRKFVPVDIIIIAISTIFLIIYIVVVYYYTELEQLWTASLNIVERVRTQISRSLIKRELQVLPLFAPPYTEIYPPHYHLQAGKDREKLCFKNCYQKLYRLKPENPKDCIQREQEQCNIPDYASVPVRYWERWNLDLALQLNFRDIWLLAIRHVHVSLLQQIVLWKEKQVERYKGKQREVQREELHTLIANTFQALFDTGNYVLRKVEEMLQRAQPGSELFETCVKSLSPEDQQHELLYFRPIYPFQIHSRPVNTNLWLQQCVPTPIEQVSLNEKLCRTQHILIWLTWKYSPLKYIGLCGEKLYEVIRGIVTRTLTQFFKERFETSYEEGISQIVIDFLFFSAFTESPQEEKGNA